MNRYPKIQKEAENKDKYKGKQNDKNITIISNVMEKGLTLTIASGVVICRVPHRNDGGKDNGSCYLIFLRELKNPNMQGQGKQTHRDEGSRVNLCMGKVLGIPDTRSKNGEHANHVTLSYLVHLFFLSYTYMNFITSFLIKPTP